MADAKFFTLDSSYIYGELYRFLGIEDADVPNATKDTIRSAYRNKQKEFHTDKIGSNILDQGNIDPFILEAFQRYGKALADAYTILGDEGFRKYYDQNKTAFVAEINKRRITREAEVQKNETELHEARLRAKRLNEVAEKGKPERDRLEAEKKKTYREEKI